MQEGAEVEFLPRPKPGRDDLNDGDGAPREEVGIPPASPAPHLSFGRGAYGFETRGTLPRTNLTAVAER